MQVLSPMAAEFAALFGRRTPRFTAKEKGVYALKLRRHLRSARPYILGLYTLETPPDRDQCVYALLEGLFKEQLRVQGKKIRDNQDAFDVWLNLTQKAATSPHTWWAKSPSYCVTKQTIYEFLIYIHQHLNLPELNSKLDEWRSSKEARKTVQFARFWPVLIRKSKQSIPKRLTTKLADQLSDEYRACSSFLEMRLKLFVWLDDLAQRRVRSWSLQEKRKLSELLTAAESRLHLASIGGFIDRHVRNALAHGGLEVNLDLQECRFHDQAATVTWKRHEFFRKTKELTLAARALMEFETILSFVQAQIVVRDLWKRFTPKNMP